MGGARGWSFGVLFSVAQISLTWMSFADELEGNLAKGLDTLKPKVETKPQPVVQTPAPKVPEKAVLPEPALPTEPATTEQATSATEKIASEVHLEPSATSKALAGKLGIFTDLGFYRILDAPEGEWTTNANASGGILWRFGLSPTMAIRASFRYVPNEVTVESGIRSYRGIVETYLGGGIFDYKWRSMHILASLELGYTLVYLKALDHIENEDIENSEMVVALGSGVDWDVFEKFKVGPRLYAGLGNFQTIQVSGAATFLF